MTYLVDSDWVADYLKGRIPAVSLLADLFAEGLAISIITFGEVYEGIYYGTDPQHNELIFRRFLRGVRVLGINRPIARRFALIRGKLRAEGQIIPQPDVLIAATAPSMTSPCSRVTSDILGVSQTLGFTNHTNHHNHRHSQLLSSP